MLFISACKSKDNQEKAIDAKYEWFGLKVTASAYNSMSWQTTAENPSIAAWGDTLKPGMKSIAIFRDLLKMGLTQNTMVKIGNWLDNFYVKDKMNGRWHNLIDIYTGLDFKKARKWGRKTIDICYAVTLGTFQNVKP